MFIDSHAHLTSDDLYDQAGRLIEHAQNAHVNTIINICTDLTTLERGLILAEKFPGIANVGSTTPHDVEKEGELYFEAFSKAAHSGQLVAIGETGLDYYYEHSAKELQKEFFIRYLELAKACKLPVVIHCRDAFEDFFSIIDQHFTERNKGVLHCFTGTLKEAKALLERGWFISFSGIITFKKSETLREVVHHVPLEKLFIETDSPYLAPQSRRGKINEPAYVVEVAQKIAEVKGLRLEEVAKQTSQNARHFFGLKGS